MPGFSIMEKKNIRILYIDDEVNNLNSFKAEFRYDYTIFIAESAAEGLKIVEEEDLHIIITDQRMPEMTGIELLESIIDKYPHPIRILLTAYADIEAAIDAINKGRIYKYISKPWNAQEIRIIIKNALEVFSLRKENKSLLNRLMEANKQLEFLLRQKLLS